MTRSRHRLRAVESAARPVIRGGALAVVLALALGGGGCARAPRADRPPDVVLLTIDTLRRDHLGIYGNPEVRTPGIDRLARRGVLGEMAVAPFGRTTQSVGTIHTGLHPLRHGADFLGATLTGEVETLGELFGRAGYRTIAYVANRSLEGGLGFEQGFDEYTNRDEWWAGDPGQRVAAEAVARVAEVRGAEASASERARPLFLWVHFLEPHWPYAPRPVLAEARVPGRSGRPLFPRGLPQGISRGHIVFEADERLGPNDLDYARRLYGVEVEEADWAVRRLVRGLEAHGVLDDACLLFTSDHGESLGEQRYWFSHGQYAYESSLQVPLFVTAKGVLPAGGTLRGTVRLEDVAPTLLDLAELPVPGGLDGRSLLDAMPRRGVGQAPPVTAIHLTDHTKVSGRNPRQTVDGREGRWWVIREGNWKFLRVPVAGGDPEEELYDLASDPGERDDLRASRSDVGDRLRENLLAAQRALLPDGLPTGSGAEPESLDAARIEALRSLGYID